jgi:hypothetical protein
MHGNYNIKNKNVCFDFLYNFERFLILRRIQQDVINLHRYSWKVAVILVRFNRR